MAPPKVARGTQDFPPPDPAFAPMMLPVGKTKAAAQVKAGLMEG